MLFRFSLYGFLKNQRYYEPFLILAFLDKGMSFFEIGVLVGFREICVNVMEVPTGAIADVVGRRRSMIFSFLGYIVAFVTFALAREVWLFFPAMFFFSIGEAFRTGTHKAIIFDWLARQGRAGEKTKVYGFTRSWSKMGSALSALIAPVLVIVFANYSVIFLACLLPYTANIVNFLTYPAYLDGPRKRHGSVKAVMVTLAASFRDTVRSRPLRRLIAESMGFEGVFKVSKEFLQPVVKSAALALPLFVGLGWGKVQRTAVLIGVVYAALHLLSSFASRHADTLARRSGSEEKGARWLWVMDFAAFGVLTGGVLAGVPGVAIIAFISLAVIQNFWRPMLISRFADRSDPEKQATLLSIESQAKSLFAAAILPVMGLLADNIPHLARRVAPSLGLSAETSADTWRFLPIGLLGMVMAGAMLVMRPSAKPDEA